MDRGQKFVNPFLPSDIARNEPEFATTNPLKEELALKIRDMESGLFPDRSVMKHVADSILDLTVQDLNDLAAQISGVESYNPVAKGLTYEDIRGIEAVFFESKSLAIEQLGQIGGSASDLAAIDVSCCCCTPCCCCAAVDVDPFEEPVAAFAR